ncbi:acetolactate synthase large subunit [Plantactinospora endophytica]|uniref:Acetolactate synthase I/II/III large subunit n=1 Tax=Plantactinospora endophytica TaxID=673535 RepID=A0ABQ4E086_9ACTN|nr:acetolactate synthase large subunit [Plantactinospora endophytica]GIG88133.1 acetolactate synthase I/II/III large subunit [Plantactinospora endophytica]
MNGAESLLRTLAEAGVEVCFSNPGTTELHLVGALDAVPGVRAVLGLFEGVATGAADGYARIAGKPAATLLHLGPGLGHGLSNLHNARRANSPIVNIVGDHPTYHKPYDPPLESDIETVARSLRGPVRRPENAAGVRHDAISALAEALEPPGQIATLIMPADVSWADGVAVGGDGDRPTVPARPVPAVSPALVDQVAQVLRSGEESALVIGGTAGQAAGLYAASRIAAASGARVFLETYASRVEHGAGLPSFPRLGFYPEQVLRQLDGARHVVVAGTSAPVAFFAYPDQPSRLVPDGAQTHVLAEAGQDAVGALTALADLLAPDSRPEVTEPARPAMPTGPLTVETWPAVIGALLPDRAIVIDETISSGIGLPAATAGAPRHDVLAQCGGAMGEGMPLAIGAAIAAPDRPVIALEADGCAIYTLSALWTQARENLNVTNVILNNRSYAILREEWQHLGAGASDPHTNKLLDLSGPEIDFVGLARAFGVAGSRASTAEELAEQFTRALAEPGPHLIEAVIPPTA